MINTRASGNTRGDFEGAMRQIDGSYEILRLDCSWRMANKIDKTCASNF